jgi:hypothetical protein
VQLRDWLAAEFRIGGIRANAAALAVLEATNGHPAFVRTYHGWHPERGEETDVLARIVIAEPGAEDRTAAVLGPAIAAV